MNRSIVYWTGRLCLLAWIAAVVGCDYSSPAAPEDSSEPGSEGAVISIGATGMTPGTVAVAPGQSVTFVNADSVPHEIVSGPVPTYDECPSINRVGRLAPGQRMQTGALTATRSCGFLDLLRTGDTRWHGTITVQ